MSKQMITISKQIDNNNSRMAIMQRTIPHTSTPYPNRDPTSNDCLFVVTLLINYDQSDMYARDET